MAGKDVDDLPLEVSYGFGEWGIDQEEYDRLHRFAMTQRDLSLNLEPIAGAAPALRRLSRDGVRIRIITHRFFIKYFHREAAEQTVAWLDSHGIPYWDLCLIRKPFHDGGNPASGT
jgi:hypothetical protein